jgi:hypothetical protein
MSVLPASEIPGEETFLKLSPLCLRPSSPLVRREESPSTLLFPCLCGGGGGGGAIEARLFVMIISTLVIEGGLALILLELPLAGGVGGGPFTGEVTELGVVSLLTLAGLRIGGGGGALTLSALRILDCADVNPCTISSSAFGDSLPGSGAGFEAATRWDCLRAMGGVGGTLRRSEEDGDGG